MAPSPTFVLLGSSETRVDSAVVPIGTPKQRAVLAVLVINRNKPVASETLIDAVWGHDAPAEARASLHAYVSNLRRLLRTAGADGRGLLEKASPGYRLNIADADVDLGRFVVARTAGLQPLRRVDSRTRADTSRPRCRNGRASSWRICAVFVSWRRSLSR